MKQNTNNNHVTKTEFRDKMDWVGREFDKVNQRFKKVDQEFNKVDQQFNKVDQQFKKVDQEFKKVHQKIDNLALHVIKHDEEFAEIRRTMATKDDVNLILNRIDHFAKRIDTYDKKAIVHDYRLNQLETQVAQHDKRLAALD